LILPQCGWMAGGGEGPRDFGAAAPRALLNRAAAWSVEPWGVEKA